MGSENLSVLFVEDNPGDARLFQEMLEDGRGYNFKFGVAQSLQKGKEKLSNNSWDVVLLDLSLPDSHGLKTVDSMVDYEPDAAVVVLTGLQDEETGLEAVRRGTQDYLIKGQVDAELLLRAITYAIERFHLEKRLRTAVKRIETEFSVIADLQANLLPRVIPDVSGLDISTYYSASEAAGGDYYDFFIPGNDKCAVLLADVSGHGVHASVIMAMTRVIAHNLKQLERPDGVLDAINQDLYANLPSARFVACCYGVVDLHQMTFNCSVAGHQPPFYAAPQSGRGKYLGGEPQMPLGLRKESDYSHFSTQLSPGGVLLLHTDGVVDAGNKDGESFGEQRLRDVVEANVNEPARVIKDELVSALREHTEDSNPTDDITFIALRVE